MTDLIKSNLVMIEDINKQRDSNRMLKLKVQSDIGELRRIYQVTGYKAEQPESMDTTPSGEFPRDQKAQSEDLTIQLYRNRQRLMALRSAVQELENKTSSLSTSFAPSSLATALPPIECISAPLDDVRPTSVFMTARVPLNIAMQSASDGGSRTDAEAEAEAEEEAKVEAEEDKDELYASLDDKMPSKLHDFSTDIYGEVNRRPSIHLASDF